ncbi:molybdopterin-dependent oxidoreductase [Candidatus Poribacteria bacterium]|nr:molybdopterin-dependent oxidoreductase [Candidatus Poribacteria bacterium]
MRLTRRYFLKMAGAGAAAAGAWRLKSRPVTTAADSSQPPSEPGQERWVKSACLQCPATCGLNVRVVDGHPVKIEGNPEHPINRGGLCPKGQAGLQVLYDPDRIRSPLKCNGERGSGNFKEITWQEAITEVAGRLSSLRETGQSHTVGILTGRCRGTMGLLIDRFLEAYGSPNNFAHGAAGTEPILIGNFLTNGVKDYFAYDWAGTDYLLCFGASFLEAWRTGVHLQRAYGLMRRGRPGERTKIVVIDPRFSVTAAKADEWVPINPGTDSALALAVAHVFVKESLYDSDYVGRHGFGFEDWTHPDGTKHMGFRTLVLNQYSPETVSPLVGVSADTIYRLAEEFAANKPALAMAGRGACGHSSGAYTQMAVNCLNALLGSFEIPGGALAQREPPWDPLPKITPDALARSGRAQRRLDSSEQDSRPFIENRFDILVDNIAARRPYPLNTLFLYYSNPLYSFAEPRRMLAAVRTIPFVVSFSPFMDESCKYADLILPDHTYLERWQDAPVEPSVGFAAVGLRQPVTPPLYNTMNAGDCIIRIARELGGPTGAAFPWPDYEELLKERFRSIYRNTIPRDKTFEEFWEHVCANGGWWEQQYIHGNWENIFKTSGNRFAFFSHELQRRFEESSAARAKREGITRGAAHEKNLQDFGIQARGDVVYLPHYEPARFIGAERDFPLRLNLFKTMTQAEGRGANEPYLQEIFGLHLLESWNSWVELSREDAHEFGISDGDDVWVESAIARIRAKARIYAGAKPGVLNMPYGQGHTSYGRWAENRGSNPNEIVPAACDQLGGSVAGQAVRVRIYRPS